ncbi:MAG: Rep family protein [Clostridium sp.]|nr:Rep family protein [Acetatifactor muris]MCM1527917.1 Rep family protein [Bacteroides sp.]MCM1564018.1 Rep family protein [Clostridium sp.]
MKSRVFHCVQYEFNPKDGTDFHFNENNITNCLAHKSIKKYAYIKHDKDVYTKDDKELYGHNIGDLKNDHWHVILKTDVPIDVEVIAKWLGVPPQQIEIPKGKGAFLDNVQYLTHESEKEQNKGKHLYSDDEIKANFDFRAELTQRAENKLKYGRDLDHEQQILYDVMYGGKTIRQVIDEDKIFYMNSYKKVDSARLKYIQQCNPPTMRINYYIEGKGGVGKGLASRAIARSLYPDLEKDDDIFFCIGDGKATFEGYDGQPVIIWNDCRSFELFNLLGSRGNIFNVFDIHPQAIRQNVKYSSINLINTVNIVNSVQSYQEFLNGLAGEYNDYKSEDKSQSYRRFPIITLLRQDDISVLLNKGVFEDSIEDFTEYIQYSQLVGNFQKIAQACGNNFPIQRKIETQFMQPVIEKHNELLAKNNQTYTDEELLEMFKEYGKPVPVDPTLPF